jgi:hypothetical protein
MATDNSPPRIRIILTIAFSSLVILITLNYVFRSYFLMMTEEVEHDHLAKPEELIKLRAGEQKNLTTAPLPIGAAMQELASKGRTNYAAFMAQADITPEQSSDMGPMVGWVRNPNQAVIDAITAAAADAGPAAPEAAGDAGTATAATALSDAGVAPKTPGGKPAPKMRAADAGAH